MKWLTIFIMKVHLDKMTWMKFEGLMHPTLNTNLMLMVLDSARRGEGLRLYKRIFSSLSGPTVSAVRMAAVQWRYKDFNVLSILLFPWGQAKRGTYSQPLFLQFKNFFFQPLISEGLFSCNKAFFSLRKFCNRRLYFCSKGKCSPVL